MWPGGSDNIAQIDKINVLRTYLFNVVNLIVTDTGTTTMLIHHLCLFQEMRRGGWVIYQSYSCDGGAPSMSATVYGREGTISGFTPIQRVFPHATATHTRTLLFFTAKSRL
jgi:hypothetical protein